MEPFLLTLVLALGRAVPAGDGWRPTDGWFTLHHDAARTGRTESSPGAPFEHLWHNEHWEELIAPEAEPIVAEGLVFYGTFRGFLRGVEADTGKEVWKVDLGLPIRHAPAYDGGRVHAATFGRSGAVVALEARTGKEIWRFRPGRPGGFASSPAVDGGAVYIGDRAGDFHALDAASGRPRWTADLGAMILQTASIRDGRVAVAAEDLVPRLLDGATGKEIWRGPQMEGSTVRAYYPFFWRDLVVWRTDTGALDAYHGDIVAATEEGRKWQETRQMHGWSEKAEEIIRGLVAAHTEEKYRKEQEHVQRRMREGAHPRSFRAFRVSDGTEPMVHAVGYHASENGYSVPAPAPQDAEGNLYVFSKSIFSEWPYPIRAFDAVSILDPATGLPALIRGIDRRRGSFPATCDESNNLTVAGGKLFDAHDHVLAYMELATRKVVNAYSSHAPELWGGVISAHATNGPKLPRESPGAWKLRDPSLCLELSIQWNGPAQGAVAIHGDKVWWITGSMVICLRGKS